MTLRTLFTQVAVLAALCLGASASFALTLDGSGRITNWGLTPFSNADGFGDWANGAPPGLSGVNGIDTGYNNGITYVEGNNAAPINYRGITGLYPTGPDFVPAPSNVAAGEVFDNEFLGWRINGSNLEILAITSINPVTGAARPGSANRFHPGDIFIDADGDQGTGLEGYEFAAALGNYTSDRNDPLHPGDDNPTWDHPGAGLYETDANSDIHHISDEGGFGGNAIIEGFNNPFAVRGEGAVGATLLGAVTYTTASYNYGVVNGANEDGTWILEWVIDLSLFGGALDLDNLTMHFTTECGNDFLETEPVVPEPATLSLLGLGLASIGALRRRSRKA